MTAANFPAALSAILTYEGGWADNPADPGGATMKGVTLAVYSHWLGRPASKDELRAITDAELQAIYRAGYWNAIRGDALPAGIDLIVFDTAVNSGPGRAAKLLQGAAGVTADGAIGPATLAAVRTVDPAVIINAFSAAHEAFYRSLPTFPTFGKGWLNRLHAVQQRALSMAST